MRKSEFKNPIRCLLGKTLHLFSYTIASDEGVNFSGDETETYLYARKSVCNVAARASFMENYVPGNGNRKGTMTSFANAAATCGACIQHNDYHVQIETHEHELVMDEKFFSESLGVTDFDVPIESLLGKMLVLHGNTVFCVEGLGFTGHETSVSVYATEEQCLDATYDRFRQFWSELVDEDKMLESDGVAVDYNYNPLPELHEFKAQMQASKPGAIVRFADAFSVPAGSACIQLSDYHIQFESRQLKVPVTERFLKGIYTKEEEACAKRFERVSVG